MLGNRDGWCRRTLLWLLRAQPLGALLSPSLAWFASFASLLLPQRDGLLCLLQRFLDKDLNQRLGFLLGFPSLLGLSCARQRLPFPQRCQAGSQPVNGNRQIELKVAKLSQCGFHDFDLWSHEHPPSLSPQTRNGLCRRKWGVVAVEVPAAYASDEPAEVAL